MRVDPIIAVKDVELTSLWYQSIFGWKSKHGGTEFDVLIGNDDEIMLCLHKWGEHDHPTMMNDNILPGNGLILYFRVEKIDNIRQKLSEMEYLVVNEIHISKNSMKREFSLRDPNGYYLTIAEFHLFEG